MHPPFLPNLTQNPFRASETRDPWIFCCAF
jgi:hypothetical protein